MTDKEKLEAVRAEIEKRKKFYYDRYTKKGIGCIEESRYDECVELLDFINFLPKEPVNEEWIEELRAKLDSMPKEDFKKVFDKYAVVFNDEPVSEELEKIVEEIADPTILNAYGTKEFARRLHNTICGTSVSEDLEKFIEKSMPSKYCWSGNGETTLYTRKQMVAFCKADAQWQKEKMMSKAVDAIPCSILGKEIIYTDLPKGIEVGDKAKVIIIKEE